MLMALHQHGSHAAHLSWYSMHAAHACALTKLDALFNWLVLSAGLALLRLLLLSAPCSYQYRAPLQNDTILVV